MTAVARSSRKMVEDGPALDTGPVDSVTMTQMLQMAQIMQQLPAATENVPIRQLAQAREALDAVQAAPAPALATPAQHVDTYA